jgi:hypothetical protein
MIDDNVLRKSFTAQMSPDMTHATKFKRLFIGWSSPVCGIISKSVCRGILAGKETKADISKETNSVLVKKAQ